VIDNGPVLFLTGQSLRCSMLAPVKHWLSWLYRNYVTSFALPLESSHLYAVSDFMGVGCLPPTASVFVCRVDGSNWPFYSRSHQHYARTFATQVATAVQTSSQALNIEAVPSVKMSGCCLFGCWTRHSNRVQPGTQPLQSNVCVKWPYLLVTCSSLWLRVTTFLNVWRR